MFCIQILLFNDIWSWILQVYCTTDFFPPFLFSPVPRFCEWLHYADFLCVCGSDNRTLWSSTSTYMWQVRDWHDYIPVLVFLLESVPHSSFDLLSSFSVSTCSRLAHLRYAFLHKAAVVLPLMPGLAWLTCAHVMWWNGGPYHSAPPPLTPPPRHAYLSPMLCGELLEDRRWILSVVVSSIPSRVLLLRKGALYRVHE